MKTLLKIITLTVHFLRTIYSNYRRIKQDIVEIIEAELERIKDDPDLQHLIQQGK